METENWTKLFVPGLGIKQANDSVFYIDGQS